MKPATKEQRLAQESREGGLRGIEELLSGLIWQMQCWKKGVSTSREVYISIYICICVYVYADLCQIRASAWIKLGPQPENLWKLFVDFLFYHYVKLARKTKAICFQGGIQFQLLNIPWGESELKRWFPEPLSRLVRI